MKKIKYLYHGSLKKLKGEMIPFIPQDVGKVKNNIIKGVYATNKKNVAIAMALIKPKGIAASLYFKPPKAIVYRGWPRRKYFYLYTLPRDSFKESPKGSGQWVSRKPIKPIKVERLEVRNYLNLLKKATKKQKEEFYSRLKK